VFELFQDLDRFNLGDYQKYDDEGQGMQRLVNFISRSTRLAGNSFNQKDATLWELKEKGKMPVSFTSDRDRAVQNEKVELLGLEHPVVKKDMQQYLNLAEVERAVFGKIEGVAGEGLLIVWKIDTHAKDGQASHHVVNIAMTDTGERAPWLERLGDKLLTMEPAVSHDSRLWQNMAAKHKQRSQELLHRELLYSGVISDEMSYSAKIVSVFGIN
ncbi:helicase, partial [bacterium]|nr:helicase [bacterium]